MAIPDKPFRQYRFKEVQFPSPRPHQSSTAHRSYADTTDVPSAKSDPKTGSKSTVKHTTADPKPREPWLSYLLPQRRIPAKEAESVYESFDEDTNKDENTSETTEDEREALQYRLSLASERAEPSFSGKTFDIQSRRTDGHSTTSSSYWRLLQSKAAPSSRARKQTTYSTAREHVHEAPHVYERVPNRASLFRARELGYGHFGSLVRAKNVEQEIQRLALRDLRKWRHWTGASKDVVTSAWSLNGQSFAVGSSADMDDLNIQYNNGNNLVYGNLLEESIYELPDHHVERPRPETISYGDNAFAEVYSSQDPRLFTTVTSVCFDSTSRYLLSSSFDDTVKIWDVESSSKPSCLASIPHQGKVHLLSVSSDSDLFVSAQEHYGSPLQLFQGFQQPKVVRKFQAERPKIKADLRFTPSALKWGNMPFTKHLFMAGFSESKTSHDYSEGEGYIGIWDAEYGRNYKITPNTQTVFDLSWCSNGGVIAAATTIGNRLQLTHRHSTNSLVRIFSPLEGPSCRCEYECPALDINEVNFHPLNHHYITASCTDGSTYMWDSRKPTEVLNRFEHGLPHDPLSYSSHTLTARARAREREELDTGVRFVSWDEYGRELLTGSSDGIIKRWDPLVAPEDSLLDHLAEFDSNIMTGHFSPDRTNLLVGLSKGSIHILTSAAQPSKLDDGELKPSSEEFMPLTYCPAEQPIDDDENAGTNASRELVDAGEISLHPVLGACQGPSYQGPYSRHARSRVTDEAELACTDLNPEVLVTQLHPVQRKHGRKMGARPTSIDKQLYKRINALARTRLQHLNPKAYEEIMDTKSRVQKTDSHSMSWLELRSNAFPMDSTGTLVEPFWGGSSTESDSEESLIHTSPDNMSVDDTTVTQQCVNNSTANTAQLPLPTRDVTPSLQGVESIGNTISASATYKNRIQHREATSSVTSVQSPNTARVKTPSTPQTPFRALKVLPSDPQWKEPPIVPLTPRERKEKRRRMVLEEARRARNTQDSIEIDDD